MPTLTDSKGEYFAKQANEVLDFSIDWSARLGNDTVASSNWVTPAGITKGSNSFGNSTTTVWLSGGTAGTDYDCVNTITTAGALTLIQTLRIKVIPPASVSTGALISLDVFKRLSGLSDTVPDADPMNDLYKFLIESASSEIKGYCGRNFIAGDYTDQIWTDQPLDGIALREFPIAYVQSVHDSLTNGILLNNPATSAVGARAWVAPDRKLYLQTIGGASNGILTIDLTAAATDTIGELVSAINGIGSGWSAGLATGVQSYDLCEYLIESVGVPVTATGLYLKKLGEPLGINAFCAHQSGLLYLDVPANSDQPSLWVRYHAGYTTIPEELQLLTARYALAMQGELGRDPSLDSERIGDYSYTRSGSGSRSPLLVLESQLKQWKTKAV
jgi:hypothetical protein